MPHVTLRCLDPWTKDVHEFTGVSLYDLLTRVGMTDGAVGIEVTAENGYAVGIRSSDLKRLGHVLAYRMDGVLLPGKDLLRRRGALIVAFDLAAHSELNASVYRYQFIWQASAVQVR